MPYPLRLAIPALAIVALPLARSQNLSVGAIVGTGLTADVRTLRQPVILPPPYEFRFNVETSRGRSVIAGGTIEWDFRGPLSLEADGIYRRLRGTGASGPYKVVTWEFPVLAKYRFDFEGFKSFLAAGPSFRTAGNLNSSNPSHFGVTSGVGFEVETKWVKMSPTVRYTLGSR